MKKTSTWHDKQSAIGRKALAWVELQTRFMPGITGFALTRHLTKAAASLKLEESTINIILPSSLRTSDRVQLCESDISGCNILISSEKALRIAQMDDSLDGVKRLLKSKTSTKDYTRRNVFGQRGNTRAQSTFKRLEKKIRQQADRYRRAYRALLALDPNGQWQSTYRQLENEDIKLYARRRRNNGESEEDDEDKENAAPASNARVSARSNKRRRKGEGHRTNSWIWEVRRGSSEEDLNEADDGSFFYYWMFLHLISSLSISDLLRVLWARGKARGERWTEEVTIVLEEMRRTLSYCEWKSNWWKMRQNARTGCAELMDGLSAYALKQAHMWTTMADSFASEWEPIIRQFHLPSDWPSPYCDRFSGQAVCDGAANRNWTSRVKDVIRMASLQAQSKRGRLEDNSVDSPSSSESD